MRRELWSLCVSPFGSSATRVYTVPVQKLRYTIWLGIVAGAMIEGAMAVELEAGKHAQTW